MAEAVREQQEGRLERAEQICAEMVAADPNDAAALHLMGIVVSQQGCPGQAVELLQRSVAIDASNAEAQTNLGVALHEAGRSREGLPYLKKGVELAPQSVRAVESCFRVLQGLEDWAEAVVYGEQWVSIAPEQAKTSKLLGDCYVRLGLCEQATGHYRKALELEPDSFDAANNLAASLASEGHHKEALVFYQRAVELRPEIAAAWANLGSLVMALGRMEIALQCHDMALTLEPSRRDAPWNRALCLLAMGRLAEGWADYERRWEPGVLGSEPQFPQPRWDGSNPAGKTILVNMEQGLGDQIMFASMLPELLRAGAHCVVACEPRLMHLFVRSFPGSEAIPLLAPPHPRTQRPDIDFQVPAGSLARWLRPTIGSFPGNGGYLVANPARADHWKKRMDSLGEGVKVGVCWRSMMTKGSRWTRYSRLTQWGAILTTRGVRFVNLQYDKCDEELREAEGLFGTRIHAWDDTDLKDDQEDVASLISELDLVISAGTAVDQLAGALGKPVWVLMRGSTDVWGLGTEHCPWHPSARLFPCGADDPWEPVIQSVAAELHKVADNAAGALFDKS